MAFEILLDIDFQDRLQQLRQDQPADLCHYEYNHCVLRNGKVIGSLMSIINVAMNEFRLHDAEIVNTKQFHAEALQNPVNFICERTKPVVFIDLFQQKGDNEEFFGKLVIELFSDICPRGCLNFSNLCTGERGSDDDGLKLSYKSSPIHRIVPDGWIQCGDIVDGSGSHNKSSYTDNIEDESFSVQFDNPQGGIVGYVSSGPHSNGSQFFITLGACDWMNCNKVGIGQVIQGYDILRKLNATNCNNQRPVPKIFIGACGKMK